MSEGYIQSEEGWDEDIDDIYTCPFCDTKHQPLDGCRY